MAELFVPALSDAWLTHVAQISQNELGLDHLSGARLSRAVTDVSHTYTRERGSLAELRSDQTVLGARLQFFLSRDLLKIHGPLAELQSVGALPAASAAGLWRVLDLGAGLGSTSLGIARFAAVRGGADRLSVTAVDIDAEALSLFDALARDVSVLPGVPITLQTYEHDMSTRLLPSAVRGPFELIVMGLALNELSAAGENTKDTKNTESDLCERILACADLLTDDGCLIILEPALRETSRALQALRDRLAARAAAPYVFAPCLHAGGCPMLLRERDYCHERVPSVFPDQLAKLAEQAGLRDHDLTYSYLTLHRQPRSLRELQAPEPHTQALFRVISGQLASKGKTELWLCRPEHAQRAMRLDRHRTPENRLFEHAARGSVLALAGAALQPEGTNASMLRIGKEASVQLVQTWMGPPGPDNA